MGGQNSLLAFLFLFLLTLLPCKGWADSWTDPSESGLVLEYTDVDGGVSITKITNAPSTLIIPSKINEKSVVAIGTSVYSSEEYTSLVIPASVKSIGERAFAGCKLSDVTMESSAPCTLGTSAFGDNFSSYSSIYIPLGSKASYLEATSWSNYQANLVELITDETGNLRFKEYKQGELYLAGFVAGKSAESITIPATITVNGQELPVTGTYSSAFTSKNISSVTFAKDSQLKVIGQGAFSQTSLTKVTIPASVTKMEAMAFGSCSSLTTVIMESATPCTLTYAPFRGCSSDLKIYVPVGTVETYKSKSDWSDYKNQIFEMPTPPITDETGTLLFEKNADGDGLILKGFVDGKSATSITVPAAVDVDGTSMPVKEIGENALQFKTSLTSVTIEGENLEKIGNNAFLGAGLKSIVIPASVKTLGGHMFEKCSSLESVEFKSETPTYAGAMKIFGESGVPANLKIYVPAKAYETYCIQLNDYKDNIVSPYIVDGNYTYELNGDGDNTVTLVKVESDGSSYDPISFPGTFEKDGTTYTVTQIGKGEKIFTGTRSIYASADAIPNTVNTIGANAFDGIYFRDGAVIPASVKNIGDGAFVTHYSESNVGPSAISVTLKSKSAFAVGEKIFGEQKQVGYEFSISVSEDLLESFKATTGWDTYKDYFISEIVDNGLRYRKYQNQEESHLTLVGFDEESTDAKDKVVIPADVNGVPVTYIEQNAFKGKSSLTSLDLSQATNLKVISYYAFMQTSLTEVVIPANVTTICTAAFGEISTLKKVTLYPTDITLYDSSNNPYWTDQFMGCSNLEDVWVPKGTKSTYLKLFGSMANKDEIIKEMDNSIIVGDYTYELNADGETVTVLGLADDAENKYTVNIPPTINVTVNGVEKDCKVTAIAADAFKDSHASVTVGKNVTSVGANALDGAMRITFLGTTAPELGANALGSNWGADLGIYITVPVHSASTYSQASTWSSYQDAIMAEPFEYNGGKFTILADGNAAFVGYKGDETEYSIPERVHNNNGSYEVVRIMGGKVDFGAIEKLTIPSTVKTIDEGAFSNVDRFKEITYLREDASDVTIGNQNLQMATALEAIYVKNQEMLQLIQNKVDEQSKNKVKLAAQPVAPITIEDDGETGITAEMEGKTYAAGQITYKRTFSQAGQYGTIALPFNVASSEWNEYFDAVYTVSGAESMGNGLSKLKFQEVDKNASLNAKDAYFVKLKDGVLDVTLTNAEETQIVADPMVNCHPVSYDGNDGTVTITPHASWQKVVGNGTQYYTFNADGTFGKSDYVVPFRMCLTIETSGGGNFIGAPAFFSIELPGGATTGINGVSAEKASKNAAIYSIDGKLVRANGDTKDLAKGVYIIGGKKIVVK